MKKLLISLLLVIPIVLCAACGSEPYHPPKSRTYLQDVPIEHETKFGGVYIHLTIDEFNARSYEYGDSVKITFSNGFVLDDLPYFNGFYVDMGEPLLVAYPGYPYIRAGYNNGEDMWVKAGLTEADTATIELKEKGKYRALQEAMDIHYTDTQDGRTDAEFANFRAVNVGNLKENVLYRSASPCDNQHKRASTVDRLIAEAGVNYIINLSDDDAELEQHIAKDDFNSPYFLSLYEANKVEPLSMNMAYKGEEFSAKLIEGLASVLPKGLLMAAGTSGPYLVHCVEGKDRTGFVCVVIEALAGATYEELVADYMITYYNYYGIDKETDPEKYEIIKSKYVDVMLEYITGDEGVDIETADYAFYAEKYLISLGMSENDVAALKRVFLK